MRARKKSLFLFVLKPVAVILLVAMVFGVVWLRSSVVSLEYRLSHLEKKRTELMKDKKTLLARRANLLYVGRLEQAAGSAGFAFPDRVKVVYVQERNDRRPFTATAAVSGAAPKAVN